MTSPLIHALEAVEILPFHFGNDGQIPNHPSFPMIIYKAVLRLTNIDPAATAERLFSQHGWQGTWRNGIYDFPHYHSNAHEVLAICRGEATVRFGGTSGQTMVVQAGDIALLPAGTGHQRLSPLGDLLVVGAYPPGQWPDLRRGEQPIDSEDYHEIVATVRRVPLPPLDPVFGAGGPMVLLWQ